jgi:hypothetical protein
MAVRARGMVGSAGSHQAVVGPIVWGQASGQHEESRDA